MSDLRHSSGMLSARPSRHRPPVPPRQGDVFTRRDGLAADWTDVALARAVQAGRAQRLRRGVYTAAPMGPAMTPQQARRNLLRLALAAAAGSSRTVVSHAAAAIAYDLPAICSLDRPCLTVQRGTGMRNLADVHLHRALLQPGDVRRWGTADITAPARTVLDTAREHGTAAGIAAADKALRSRIVRMRDLEHSLEQCATWPGRAAARTVVRFADPLAESPLESISRLRVLELGLPVPTLQANLGDPHGRFIRRVDMYWPEFGVAGEAEGNEKYDSDPQAHRAEKWQQEQLEDLGVVFVRWGWADRNRFEPVAQRLLRAFDRGVRAGQGQRWSVLRLHPHSA